MNPCTQCVHFRRDLFSLHLSRCGRPDGLRADPVTGGLLPAFCAVERAFDVDNSCGRAGRYFIRRAEPDEGDRYLGGRDVQDAIGKPLAEQGRTVTDTETGSPVVILPRRQ